jgi:acetyl-CoA C-acetyltransferase
MTLDAYIVDAVRTPRGRGNDKGKLAGVKPTFLLAQTLAALAARTHLDTSRVSDVAIGCVTQTKEQGTSIGKVGVLAAGWSDAVSAVTLNRYCASGLAAVNYAALQASYADTLAVGGGVESMSRVPMLADRGPLFFDEEVMRAVRSVHMGLAADLIATQGGFSREACDRYALASQQRAAAARAEGRFARSLVPVEDGAGAVALEADETIRPDTTLERLGAMAPAFAEMGAAGGDRMLQKYFGLERAIDHVHHAGNSPATADGASAVLMGSERAIARAGLAPRARIVAMADASVDRVRMLSGAIDATALALARAKLAARDIALYEVNESFAAPMLEYMTTLGVEPERLNVNGGAIALGHAMGATGATLVGMLADELERRGERYGVVAICGAAGVACATVIERL